MSGLLKIRDGLTAASVVASFLPRPNRHPEKASTLHLLQGQPLFLRSFSASAELFSSILSCHTGILLPDRSFVSRHSFSS